MGYELSPMNRPPAHVSATHGVASAGAPAAPPGVGRLLPEPSGVNVDFVIAKLVIDNAFASRELARENRQREKDAMVAAQKNQLAHLREEAHHRFEAARLEAFGKMGEGAAGISGGLVSTGVFGGSEQEAQAWGGAAGALGKAGGGLVDFLAADWERDAGRASAAAKEDEMAVRAHEDAVDEAMEEMKTAREHIRTALDFLRDFESTQTRAMSSAIKV